MTFHELSALTAVPERQIRYLIAEGFVPSPRGSRAKPEYGDDHVAAIRRYAELHEKGFPPAAIRLLLQDRYPVAPGIALIVDRPQLASDVDVASVIDSISSLLNNLLVKDKHDDRGSATNQD
jgi:DNA-binding transcriptional MerR regulator